MNKNIKYLTIAALILLLVLGVTFKLVTKDRKENPPELLVATDPSFTEYKGQLMSDFPEFPVYTGATLVGSAKVNTDDIADQGYRAKWTTSDPVIKVMKWYQEELIKAGWKFEENNDIVSEAEQIAKISKDELEGYLAAELEDEETEIVVDLRKD